MATTQGKVRKISKGIRVSCYANKRTHPMSQVRFLQLLAQGGNRVHNNQIQFAMVDALTMPNNNPEVIKTIVAAF